MGEFRSSRRTLAKYVLGLDSEAACPCCDAGLGLRHTARSALAPARGVSTRGGNEMMVAVCPVCGLEIAEVVVEAGEGRCGDRLTAAA